MCVAAPGTVIAIEGSIAKVDYEGNISMHIQELLMLRSATGFLFMPE